MSAITLDEQLPSGIGRLRGTRGAAHTIDYSESTAQVEKIDDNANGNVYLGYAVPGSLSSDAVWKIQRISVSGVVTTLEWADGNTSFDNVWDDRTSLTYI